MRPILVFIISLFYIVLFSQNTESYKVIGIQDGDTFTILKDGRPQKIRFAHIDAPEKKQAFGNRAKQFVSEQCFGRFIRLNGRGKKDRNGRIIAEIITDKNMNLNK